MVDAVTAGRSFCAVIIGIVIMRLLIVIVGFVPVLEPSFQTFTNAVTNALGILVGTETNLNYLQVDAVFLVVILRAVSVGVDVLVDWVGAVPVSRERGRTQVETGRFGNTDV